MVVCASEKKILRNKFNDFVPELIPVSKRLAKRDKCTKLREIET